MVRLTAEHLLSNLDIFHLPIATQIKHGRDYAAFSKSSEGAKRAKGQWQKGRPCGESKKEGSARTCRGPCEADFNVCTSSLIFDNATARIINKLTPGGDEPVCKEGSIADRKIQVL